MQLVRLVAFATAIILTACHDLPRDPERTSQRVANGTLRVGLIAQPPWVSNESGEPRGAEVELVRMLAREMNATPEWHRGGEEQLMRALGRYELDVVVGGITSKTPWAKEIGVTKPYFEDTAEIGGKREKQAHVMAVPPGENGWLWRVGTFLAAHRGEVERLKIAQEK